MGAKGIPGFQGQGSEKKNALQRFSLERLNP
jgi:hypothetical protein